MNRNYPPKRNKLFNILLLVLMVAMQVSPLRAEEPGWTYRKVWEEYYKKDQPKVDLYRKRAVGNGLNIGLPDYPRASRVERMVPEGPEQGGIGYRGFKLRPSFISKVEYDDNIKLADSEEERKDDVIFTQVPALTSEIDTGSVYAEGTYGMEINSFAKDQEENSINHLAHGLAVLEQQHFSFSVEDTFEKSTDRLSNETSTRDHFKANTVEVNARYDRPKWAAQTGWVHNRMDHDTLELDNNDYNEDVITGLGGYKLIGNTLFLIQNDFGLVYYDENTKNADQNYWQIRAGAKNELREDLWFTARAGFQARRLHDSPVGGPTKEYNGLVVDVNATYSLTPKDALQLGYDRTVKTSTFQGNSWYRTDKISGAYTHRFFKKWSLSPFVSWQINDYPQASTSGGVTAKRFDTFWQTGVDLRYRITKWASTGIGYKFRSRNSNFDDFEFINNRYTFDLTVAY